MLFFIFLLKNNGLLSI